ncbi:hypothetical protein [Chroococcidiopsis sp. CCNUC1]|uniref:hypothetical protein n=1 Tax=Chroococcidiopsis sp. CCNUC1 TaxID=2653189 RepID=UPI0020211EFA|nr:hypothetical protein [Chroococcidiopsis sp. CCNUC1]URD52811.1 hypothetical protein M5J74_12610 [Chroococcidiopsis sp. CCNUC1]
MGKRYRQEQSIEKTAGKPLNQLSVISVETLHVTSVISYQLSGKSGAWSLVTDRWSLLKIGSSSQIAIANDGNESMRIYCENLIYSYKRTEYHFPAEKYYPLTIFGGCI